MSIKVAHLSCDIVNASPVHETQDRAIELSQEARHWTGASLTGIFASTAIPALVQLILNGTITNDKFCMSRVRALPFVSARPQGGEKVEYPGEKNAGALSSQEETNDQTTVEHSALKH